MGWYAETRSVLINLLLLRLELQIQTLLRFALVRFGSVRFGSVRFGLVWFGRFCAVLCWPGLHMDMDTAFVQSIPRDQVSSFGLVCGSS